SNAHLPTRNATPSLHSSHPPPSPHPFLFFLSSSPHPPHLHSFPARRSSDLQRLDSPEQIDVWNRTWAFFEKNLRPGAKVLLEKRDRKSPRLNSSHRTISYAVFCLKKKKKKETIADTDIN